MRIGNKARLVWRVLLGRPVMYRYDVTLLSTWSKVEPRRPGSLIAECHFKELR